MMRRPRSLSFVVEFLPQVHLETQKAPVFNLDRGRSHPRRMNSAHQPDASLQWVAKGPGHYGQAATWARPLWHGREHLKLRRLLHGWRWDLRSPLWNLYGRQHNSHRNPSCARRSSTSRRTSTGLQSKDASQARQTRRSPLGEACTTPQSSRAEWRSMLVPMRARGAHLATERRPLRQLLGTGRPSGSAPSDPSSPRRGE